MLVKTYRMLSAPKAQCFLRFVYNDSGLILEEIQLISYSTEVACIQRFDDGFYYVGFSTWANTTAKHIGKFTKEFMGENLYHWHKENIGKYLSVPQDYFENFISQINRYEASGKCYIHRY